MALATTCPQCKTSFRIVPDQLKLRRGFVRCGRCRNVFAAIDHLRYVGDAQLRAEARDSEDLSRSDLAPPTEAKAAHPPHIAAGEWRLEPQPEPHPEPHAEPQSESQPGSQFESHNDEDVEWVVVGAPALDPLSEAPLDVDDANAARQAAQHDDVRADEAAVSAVAAGSGDTIGTDDTADTDDAIGTDNTAGTDDAIGTDAGEAPSYVERFAVSAYGDVAWPDPATTSAAPGSERFGADEHDGESAIDYFSTKRARGFADRRGLAAAFLVLVLAITLALQWVVAQRSSIAANAPALAPLLGTVLAPFGLRIEAPRELDALTIESFELQASAAPDVLEMRALLRNRARHPVRWPSMQLTLTDPESRVLVRRTLDPGDYLPEADTARDEGVPAHTEWPLRLALEARDLQLAGYDYRVRLFYP